MRCEALLQVREIQGRGPSGRPYGGEVHPVGRAREAALNQTWEWSLCICRLLCKKCKAPLQIVKVSTNDH